MAGFALVGLGALLAGVPALALCARLAHVARVRRQREEALDAALRAHIWREQLERVSPRGVDSAVPRHRRHDANNALSTALLSAQFLFTLSCNAPLAAGESSAEQKTAVAELVDALQRLKGLIGEGQGSVTTTSPVTPLLRQAHLLEAVSQSAARTRARHPRVALDVALTQPALERARVIACGGAEGLGIVLDALLANACEGNGAHPATQVSVRVGAEVELDAISLEIVDDGPGFTVGQLADPPRAFATTKTGHLGLGLTTAEHVLAASGGSLRRENGAGGGARLTVFLPSAPAQ
jgi:signal transduction histidine kinase